MQTPSNLSTWTPGLKMNSGKVAFAGMWHAALKSKTEMLSKRSSDELWRSQLWAAVDPFVQDLDHVLPWANKWVCLGRPQMKHWQGNQTKWCRLQLDFWKRPLESWQVPCVAKLGSQCMILGKKRAYTLGPMFGHGAQWTSVDQDNTASCRQEEHK